MKGTNLFKLAIGITALTLSTGVWANSSTYLLSNPVGSVVDTTVGVVTAPFVGWQTGWNRGSNPDYLVTDAYDNRVAVLDGVDRGMVVYNPYDMGYDYSYMNGNKITNLRTQRTGIIKGVKHQGTMDVVTPSGKNVRYQYVVFKVKPIR